MAHMVICSVCGKRFDRDKVQAVQTGARRYAHATCDPSNKNFVQLPQKIEQNDDMKKLKDYIENKYGTKAKWPLIMKQIKDFTENKNFSLSGILKSLVYFYDVKGNSVDGSNGGIGIVEYTYQDAYNYYYNLFIARSQNENKDIQNIVKKTKEIIIPVPKIIERKKFFNEVDDE
jgi:hypothetical protein